MVGVVVVVVVVWWSDTLTDLSTIEITANISCLAVDRRDQAVAVADMDVGGVRLLEVRAVAWSGDWVV